MAQALRANLKDDPFTHGWLQWGVCAGVHGARYTNTTLYSTASAGAGSIRTNAICQVNDWLMIGTLTAAVRVVSVSGGSAPFTANLQQQILSTQSSGVAVVALWTVDLYLNGTQNKSPQFLTTGIKFNEGWNPTVSDVVPVLRGPGGLRTDRFVFREMAGVRGPGNSSFVGLTSGAPPTTVPWGIGALYLDPITPRLYCCTASSIQNTSGVVTTPATWHYATLT